MPVCARAAKVVVQKIKLVAVENHVLVRRGRDVSLPAVLDLRDGLHREAIKTAHYHQGLEGIHAHGFPVAIPFRSTR